MERLDARMPDRISSSSDPAKIQQNAPEQQEQEE